LLHTLDTIAYPTGDDRSYEIVRYLTADAVVDEVEWKSSASLRWRGLAIIPSLIISTIC
jgi:hypothetical protein